MKWVGGVGGHLSLLDQTVLPGRVKYLRIRDLATLIDAIRRLAVRGAPALGCAAAYGMVIGLRDEVASQLSARRRGIERVRDRLAASRPTAVNLFGAIDRVRSIAFESLEAGDSAKVTLERVLAEAHAICREDEELCRAIGEHGARLLRSGWNVLTHCNAGSLATAGIGTALAVVYRAVEKGKRLHVFAGETRPLLQGARLTSWELQQAGVDVTVVCDSAAASVMQRGDIDCVVVGADRIAANGDVANKIGTYGVAVLAKEHGVPFYVAAPTTTIDLATKTGAEIPIEERSADEVVAGFGIRTVPRGVNVFNPAFDVTPAKLVHAIITEKGVIKAPYRRHLAALFR
jgi:methylthioribose-1-phosphate isomerase